VKALPLRFCSQGLSPGLPCRARLPDVVRGSIAGRRAGHDYRSCGSDCRDGARGTIAGRRASHGSLRHGITQAASRKGHESPAATPPGAAADKLRTMRTPHRG